MQFKTFKLNRQLVFSRWSRKPYAVFQGLGKVISIGRVSADICDATLTKSSTKQSLLKHGFLNHYGSVGVQSDNDPLEGIASLNKLLAIITYILTFSFPYKKDLNSSHIKGGRISTCPPFFSLYDDKN